jgi:hypothetical protein
MKKPASRKSSSAAPKSAAPTVRQAVRRLLERSPAFRALPPDERRQLAHDTVRVASYLVDPDRLISQEFGNPVLLPSDLLTAVNFPSFVSGLINGVFGAIVNVSIQQMEAYAELVAHAATSVSEFAADKITTSMARTEVVNRFPHLFCVSGKGGLRLAGKTSLGRSESRQLARTFGLRRPLPVFEVSDGLRVLVTAVRRRIARDRQQSLALALAMGINRIVVTDGRISAQPGR